MGRLHLGVDGSATGPGDVAGPDDGWKAGDAGLTVRLGNIEWAFQKATPGMLLGKCTAGPDGRVGTKAVLRFLRGPAAADLPPWEPPAGVSEQVRAQLMAPVTFQCVNKTVSEIALALANKAGLQYDVATSLANAGGAGAVRVATFQVVDKPCGEALRDLLAEQSLSFRVEDDRIVLERNVAGAGL